MADTVTSMNHHIVMNMMMLYKLCLRTRLSITVLLVVPVVVSRFV